MDDKIKFMLLRTVQDDNILPVTSICNMACRFCSHFNNPAGLEVYSFGHLKLELIEELIDFLPPGGPVIIGESATRIIEGDPFTHPDFAHILYLIRQKFPEKPIQLTTNGSYFSAEILDLLNRMRPVELNISLNCSNPEERVFLMRDKNPEKVFQGLKFLKEKNINFNGSIVAMPHLLGWDSLRRTIELFSRYNPKTIRVYLPGFTKFSSEEIKFNPAELYPKLVDLIDRLAPEYNFPLLLEPPLLKDFDCRVRGIIPDSPAARLPLKRNDVITRIDGREVLTRVDAFNRLVKAGNTQLEVTRNGQPLKFTLQKKKGEKPGVVLDYDLDPAVIESLKFLLTRTQAGRIAVITSVLARRMMKIVVDELKRYFPEKRIDLVPVKNEFFGGSIISAGLLVNQDIRRAFRKKNGNHYDLIILPGIIYDIFGNDLIGESYKLLAKKLKTEIEIV
ncbi:MAG: hypothetical protein PWR10_491 [Halanaerobiales bacterium]|nr:hypothetical protein [Halanaerobiales bacterium]